MRTLVLALVFSLAASDGARAQDPPKSIDQLVKELADVRARRTEIDKQEQLIVAELKLRVKELADRLAKLGLVDPLPVPPKPPVPVPPVPVPVDPLREKLRAAFDQAAGGDAQKREWARDLAELYRKSVRLAGDPRYATAAHLKAKMREAATVLLEGDDALAEVRRAVAGELAAILPTDRELTDEQRKAAAALFARLAAVLEDLAQ